MNRSEPLSRAARQAQNRTAIVATKIDRAIEALASQCGDDGPGLIEVGPSTLARHGPDTRQPRQMVENRRDFFGHEGVQSAITEMLLNGPQRRGHQCRVAVVFELDRQDFEWEAGHCVFFKLNVRVADFSKLLPIGFAAAMKRAKARAPERGVHALQRNL